MIGYWRRAALKGWVIPINVTMWFLFFSCGHVMDRRYSQFNLFKAEFRFLKNVGEE